MVVFPLVVSASFGCDKKEIVIGGLISTSGQASDSGVNSLHGFELAFAECNAAGGIHGRPVKLVLADDQSDNLGCTRAAQKLVAKDKVMAILGPAQSWLAEDGGRVCQQAKVPMVATTATDPVVTQVGDFIFRACYTDPQQGEAGAKFAYDILKSRNAASIFGKYFRVTALQSAAESFSARFSSLGGKVATDYYGDGKDPRQVLDNLLAAKPDLLYVAAPGAQAANIAKQAREKGFNGPILGTDSWDSPNLVTTGGLAMEGSYFTNHFSAADTRPEVQVFVRKYVGRFGVEPDSAAAMAYDASRLLFDSISRAGSTKGPAVRDALNAADFPGVSGRMKFGQSRNPRKPVVIIQVQSGKLAYNSTVNP
jgi:branched-chain amino acid transport system substrate-binding protein